MAGISKKDIADFLGLKLETVSRSLAKLEHKNLIRLVPNGVLLTGLEQSRLALNVRRKHTALIASARAIRFGRNARYGHTTAAEEADMHAGLFAGLENGTLRPVVGKELPLAEAARVHKEILEPGSAGKIVHIC